MWDFSVGRKDEGHEGGEKGAGAGGEGSGGMEERDTALTHRVRAIPAPVRGGGRADKTRASSVSAQPPQSSTSAITTSGQAEVGADEEKGERVSEVGGGLRGPANERCSRPFGSESGRSKCRPTSLPQITI